jgi:hypothetical protein
VNSEEIVIQLLSQLRTSMDSLTKEVHDLRVDLNTHRNQAQSSEVAFNRRLELVERQTAVNAQQIKKLDGVGEVVATIKKWVTFAVAGGITLAAILFVASLGWGKIHFG